MRFQLSFENLSVRRAPDVIHYLKSTLIFDPLCLQPHMFLLLLLLLLLMMMMMLMILLMLQRFN